MARIMLCFLALLAQVTIRGEAKEVGRAEFAKRLAAVGVSMSQADVIEAVGRPERIVVTGFEGAYAEEWHYGVDERSGFPTLGRVVFDDGAKFAGVTEVCGATGTPPAEKVISEKDLRSAIGYIAQVPDAGGIGFEPLAMIAAVNHLRPLGKEAAIAAIEEYLRVERPANAFVGDRVAMLVRVLFVPANGAPGWPQYIFEDETKIARGTRFPIVMIEGLPIYLVPVPPSAATPHDGLADLAWAKKHGELPKELLVPPANPLAALAAIEALPEAKKLFQDVNDRIRVAGQLLRCDPLRSFEDSKALANYTYSVLLEKMKWAELEADLARRSVRWDAKKSAYLIGPAIGGEKRELR
jgi:hypothetical protein